MKALLLTREYPPYTYGGAGVHVEYLSKELSKIIPVEVRCFGDQIFDDKNLKVRGYSFDANIFNNCDSLLKSPLQALNTCIAFNAEKIEADIVHCHTWYSHFGGITAKIMYGIPLVITTHSLEPLRPWKREQLGKGYDFSCWVEKTALEMADAIISVSKGTKEDILKYFNVAADKIHIIPNGIDTEEYKPVKSNKALEKYNINPDQPYLLFVGRITRQKGIIHLVNAIKYISPDVQVVLCAGEPDTKEIALEMEQAVSNVRNIRNNIVWIEEMISKPDIFEIYSNAALFCCPSIYEPFGIINLEAMACEVPVVASAVGGIKEVVINNETGLLVEFEQIDKPPFEPSNPDEFSKQLAEKINYLMNNESIRIEMGKKGRERAINYYSWQAVAKRVVELYEKEIEKRITKN